MKSRRGQLLAAVAVALVMVLTAVTYLGWQDGADPELASCPQRLSGVDMGSASTKLLIADVDPCQQRFLRAVHQAAAKVDYKHDLSDQGGEFSKEIRERGLQVLKEYLAVIEQLEAAPPVVLATEAFRQSHNAEKFVQEISAQLHLVPQILHQEQEATLSFYSALAVTGLPQESTVVWDIGGGSQQISFWGPEGLERRLVPWGSITFKERVSEALDKSGRSPNPFRWNEVMKAQELVHSNVSFPLAGRTVLGVGSVFEKSLLRRLEGSSIHRVDLEDLLARTYFLRDEELESEYPETDTTNIIMVLTLLKQHELSEVQVPKSGLLEAALTFPDLLSDGFTDGEVSSR